MRTRAILLALALLPLAAGCVEDPAATARYDETRAELARANGEALALPAETRVWQDNATRLANESAWHALQRDDLSAMLNVSQEALAASEAKLADATAALEAAERAAKPVEALARELAEAKAERARMQALYDEALAQRFDRLTTVARGNVTWQFTDLRGDTHQWRYPVEDYRQDVKRSRPNEGLYMTTSTGSVLRLPDPRPYLDTAPFEGVIHDLTNGRSERDFVREIFELKRQLIVYEFQLVDEKGYYKYPGETLVEGTGICGDTTILLASLLEAGKKQAGYRFDVALWAVDWNLALGRLVEDPQTVNHAFLEVKFSDGEVWYVETTSYEFVKHEKAHGFRFDWA